MAIMLANLRVLIVDDNPQARKILKMVLAKIGVHQIVTASDGREAQEFLDAAGEYIDIIICDWEMPRMTGLELLQQVRMSHPDMPFMMVTVHTEVESVKAAREFGVNAYIGKPYSPQQMEKQLKVLTSIL